MKIESHDGGRERLALLALVTSDVVLSRISPKWDDGLFISKWSNIIGSWCVRYFKKYGKAPKHSIESIYKTWVIKSKDADSSQLISNFLQTLSDEYERDENSDYTLDKVTEYLNEVKLRKLKDELENALEAGDINLAHEIASSYHLLDTQVGGCVDLLSETVIDNAFRETGEAIVLYEGPIAKFFGDTFARDSLVAYVAPEGTGKSFWLLDLAWRAMEQRRRVVFFECGDSTESQVSRRFLVRASKAPWKPRKLRIPNSVIVDDTKVVVSFTDRDFTEGLDKPSAEKAFDVVRTNKIKSNDSYFKLACHPTGTLSLDGLKSQLDDLEQLGYVADVVVIDYADIMQHPSTKQDRLHQIEELWQGLRSLSISRHCLVVTATQSTREAYSGVLLSRSHVSGNKLKLAYVNDMFGINQDDADKKKQVYRLNRLKNRKDGFISLDIALAGHCLAISNPCTASYFWKS